MIAKLGRSYRSRYKIQQITNVEIPMPGVFRFEFVSQNPARSVAQARANLRSNGYARTRLIELTSAPCADPVWNDVVVVLQALGERGAGLYDMANLPTMGDWRLARSFRPGTRVRTKGPGVEFSGGVEHVMPAGSMGVVASRDGLNIRVRFSELSRRTFVYATRDLERLKGAGS
jgi:hypothetical protein